MSKLSDLYSEVFSNDIFVEEYERDASGRERMDPELFEKVNTLIVNGNLWLKQHHLFFGAILSKLKTCISTEIPTMAVDNVGNIYFNPNWITKEITPKEFAGVLAHETFHIANDTFGRQQGRDPKIWNIATDYMMNRDLLMDGFSLPECGCLPEKKGKQWLIEVDYGTTKETIDISPEAQMTSERLYSKIMQGVKKEQDKQGKQQQGGKPGDQGKGKGKGKGSAQDIIDKLAKDNDTFDEHITSGEPKPDTLAPPKGTPTHGRYDPDESQGQQQDEANNRSKVTQGKAEADREERAREQAQRGSGKGSPRSWSKHTIQPIVNWRQVLKDFFTARTGTKPAARPSFGTWFGSGGGVYSPHRYKTTEGVNAVIAIDTSGSMLGNQMNAIEQELARLIKNMQPGNLLILFWTTEVYASVEIKEARDYVKLQKVQYANGGTTMSCVAKWLQANNKTPVDGILYITDGDVESNPEIPEVKGGKQPVFLIWDTYRDHTPLDDIPGKTYRVQIKA